MGCCRRWRIVWEPVIERALGMDSWMTCRPLENATIHPCPSPIPTTAFSAKSSPAARWWRMCCANTQSAGRLSDDVGWILVICRRAGYKAKMGLLCSFSFFRSIPAKRVRARSVTRSGNQPVGAILSPPVRCREFIRVKAIALFGLCRGFGTCGLCW